MRGVGVINAPDAQFRPLSVTVTISVLLQLGCVAEVNVNYTFTAITPIIGTLVGPIAMTNTTRLPVERVYCVLPQDAPCNYP